MHDSRWLWLWAFVGGEGEWDMLNGSLFPEM
jgi:hypothetical protein